MSAQTLDFLPKLVSSERFAPEIFILEQSKNSPVLAQLVTWRISVSLFRQQERHDTRDLRGDSDHRAVLSMLIGQGDLLRHRSQQENLELDGVGLSTAMVESEIRALRDNMRITHEDLISEQEADGILSAFTHA